jgi:nucleoside-diphosphate-sugar epimerase
MKFYPSGVHDWVFIDDLIKIIVNIIENKRTGAFDVGTGINTTNMLLMDTFCRVVGGDVPYDAMDIFYSKHDCLEWPNCSTPLDTFVDLEEGIRRYVQWRESQETHS